MLLGIIPPMDQNSREELLVSEVIPRIATILVVATAFLAEADDHANFASVTSIPSSTASERVALAELALSVLLIFTKDSSGEVDLSVDYLEEATNAFLGANVHLALTSLLQCVVPVTNVSFDTTNLPFSCIFDALLANLYIHQSSRNGPSNSSPSSPPALTMRNMHFLRLRPLFRSCAVSLRTGPASMASSVGIAPVLYYDVR
jgi:hypothetical protein